MTSTVSPGKCSEAIVENKPAHVSSPFRTQAWTDAWLDTYGSLKGVEIFDLGGTGNSLEMVYTAPRKLKGILPIRELSLVGCSSHAIHSPRSEYNELHPEAYPWDKFVETIDAIDWQSCFFGDFTNPAPFPLEENLYGAGVYIDIQQESTFRVSILDFHSYLARLGKSTRNRYFQKRSRLYKCFATEWIEYSSREFVEFCHLLNQFHQTRWGRPCYSPLTQRMLKQFIEALEVKGGRAILSVMLLDGKPSSVLFDLIWKGVRYNLQSGYRENISSQLKLGSIHLGFAVEEAINLGISYDFLAGTGRTDNYKAKIATETSVLTSLYLTRGVLGRFRRTFSRKVSQLNGH
jgi:hypothetical protein